MNDVDDVLSLLMQAFGEAEGRRIWGSYCLARTAVEAQRRVQAAPPGEQTTSEEAH